MITVIEILDNETLFIRKGLLRLLKRHAMFGDVLLILAVVPFEIRRLHDSNVIQTNLYCKKNMGPFQSDRHNAVRFVNKQQVAFDQALAEETLEDGPVADHLGLVLVGEMADAARLEVDEGDAVGGNDEPVYDAENQR